MDPDSTAGTLDCRPVASEQYNNVDDDDYISKLLGFDDNRLIEMAQSPEAHKTRIEPEDPFKSLGRSEEISELKVMNGDLHGFSSKSFIENNEDVHINMVDSRLNFAQKLKDLMKIKKDADELREKCMRNEREKNDLQFRVDMLEAENYQFKQMKKLKEENIQKVQELQKDLSSKLKAQQKLRNEIESCNLQISEKNDSLKKAKKDNKKLWNMVTGYARKLANAELLTAKDKSIMKKYGKEGLISDDIFGSEGQEQGTGNSSLVPNAAMCTEKNESRIFESDVCLSTASKELDSKNSKIKNDGFQFSQNNTSLSKARITSGSNYFMKSCRDVLEDLHMSDDCPDITISQLKEMREQISVSNDHFSPISPIPPSPPPNSIKFRHGSLKKDVTAGNPTLTPRQIPKTSQNQGLLSFSSPVLNSSRKQTFCHQQSEGFDAPPEHSVQRFNSHTSNLNNSVTSVGSHSGSSLQLPYKFSAKRCHDGGVKFNFHINNPITMTVNPNNWEVSCILGHVEETLDNSFSHQLQPDDAHVHACASFNNSLMGLEKEEPGVSKVTKIESISPSEVTVPVSNNLRRSSFLSVGKLNADVSVATNFFDSSLKDRTFQKELPCDRNQIIGKDGKALDAFDNLAGNNATLHNVESRAEDNRSVVSSSCESASPYKKSALFSNEFLSPSRKTISVFSERKYKESDKLLNASKTCHISLPEVNDQLENDSTGSELEFASQSKRIKLNAIKCVSVKKRRKSILMPFVESSNAIPVRNKGRTLQSRTLSSRKNSTDTNASQEEKRSKNQSHENKTSASNQVDDEKCLSEYDNEVMKNVVFDSSIVNKDPSNCLKSSEQCIKIENTGGLIQRFETLHENVNSKKRISRFSSKNSKTNSITNLAAVKQKNEPVVGKSPKKKMKRQRKGELKRMAALKNKAAEWASQQMKSFAEDSGCKIKGTFSSNFSDSNMVKDNLKKHFDKESAVVLSETEVKNQKTSIVLEAKSGRLGSFPNYSGNDLNGPCTHEKINIGTFLNVPYNDHERNDKIEENFRMANEKMNDNELTPDSTACLISNDNQLVLLPFSEVDNNKQNSELTVIIDQCDVSADLSNQITQQNITTNISNVGTRYKNVALSKASSLVETSRSPTNKVTASPLQEYSNTPPTSKTSEASHAKLNTPKSKKTKCPEASTVGKSTAQTKTTNSSNLSHSEINTDFPEFCLFPLPLETFHSIDEKSDVTLLQKKTFYDEKSTESPVSHGLNRRSGLSVPNNKEISESASLSENCNSVANMNNVKTNPTTLFEKKVFANESSIDSLVKNVGQIAGTSGNEITEKFLANTGEPIDNLVGINDMKESQASSQTVSNGITSVVGSFQPMSDVHSRIDMIIDSVAVGGVEIEVETQDPPPRACKKKQVGVVDSRTLVEQKKVKGRLKSIDLSIAEESALSNDSDDIIDQPSDVDSDIDSPLIIADDFIEEVEPSLPVPEHQEENIENKNILNKTPTKKKQKTTAKTPTKCKEETEFSSIVNAFQAIERIKFTKTHFRLHVHSLVTVLINPSVVESAQKLIFHLVNYLHNTRKNPMLSFSLSNDPDTLLPTSEQCIVKALLTVDAKNKSHLSGLLNSAIETMYFLVLGKTHYQIYGLSSLCRVMTAICKELNDPSKPRRLCCDLLKYSHKFAPFLIASIVSVYKEAFEVFPDTTDEEKIFLSALSYSIQEKPKTLTETQWKHCNNICSKYLTVEFLMNVNETIPYLKSAIEEKCLSDPYENEYELLGPLVMYARIKGWTWAQELLLEKYVLPKLKFYSEDDDGDRGFSFFANLCADICFHCPDEELSRSWLMEYLNSPNEREFVKVGAGLCLLNLILMRKELFPDAIQKWIYHYEKHPRVISSSHKYFRLRLMDDSELSLGSDIF